MKLFLLIAAVLAVSSANLVPLSSSDEIQQRGAINSTLENVKQQMPCGFPKMGIPILAPLSVNNREVNIDTEDLKFNIVLNKFRLWGLNDFTMTKFNVNPVLSKLVAEFQFPKVYTEGLYNLKSHLHKFGITINVKGDGDLDLSISDIKINIESKYSLGVLGGGVKVKTLKVVLSIGNVESHISGLLGNNIVNEKLNEVIEEMILMTVNDNSVMITETIEAVAVPIMNGKIDGRSLTQIIAAVGGGGGSGEPSEPCIPPTYD